jgi:nucleoside 2-deoxyribosyltransferase
MIRVSRFVVADFTGQRGSVYFEAGFAVAIGLPVIWLCRKDQLADVHFDTRQYNFLTWTDDNLENCRDGLLERIEKTIGRGGS